MKICPIVTPAETYIFCNVHWTVHLEKNVENVAAEQICDALQASLFFKMTQSFPVD